MIIRQPSFPSALIILFIILYFLAGVGILGYPVEFVLIMVTLTTAGYAYFMVRVGRILFHCLWRN